MKVAMGIFLAAVLSSGLARAQGKPASSAPAKKAAAAEESEEEEEVSYPSWELGLSAGVTGGYDSKASVSRIVKLSSSTGSGTTDITASIGPTLNLRETLSSSLEYSFDQTLKYSNHDLDAQTHGLELSGKYSGDRLEATLAYGISFVALIPKNVFYSIEHQPKASAEVRIIKPLFFAIEYSLHYYDIRDTSSAYLNGQVHTVEVYPDLYFSGRLDIYGGYRLQIARLGILQDTGLRPGSTISSDQSYNGHYFFLHAKWKPHKRVSLVLDGEIGRKLFPAAIKLGGPGPGIERADTFGNVSFKPSWKFWKGFSLSASFSYEHSSSNLQNGVQTSSYDAFAGTGGLRWEL